MKSQRSARVGCVAHRVGRAAFGLGLAALLTACVPLTDNAAVAPASPSPALPSEAPPMRWDHQPGSAAWTMSALSAVARHDAVLADQVPGDIAAWCPGYADAGLADRRAFWVGLMSALAKHESTWNPVAEGGRGKWFGLLQISPATARGNDCAAQSGAALKDGSANVACAVQIYARDVARDGLVSGNGNRGVGRQWAPFRKASERADMAAWTSAQPYCIKG